MTNETQDTEAKKRKPPSLPTLEAWFARTKMTERAAAELLDVSQQVLNKIRRGVVTPSLAVATRIHFRTGGEVQFWAHLPPDERVRSIGKRGRP